MKWIDALVDFNGNKKNWIVPRVGTRAYVKVMKMVRPQYVKNPVYKPMITMKKTNYFFL